MLHSFIFKQLVTAPRIGCQRQPRPSSKTKDGKEGKEGQSEECHEHAASIYAASSTRKLRELLALIDCWCFSEIDSVTWQSVSLSLSSQRKHVKLNFSDWLSLLSNHSLTEALRSSVEQACWPLVGRLCDITPDKGSVGLCTALCFSCSQCSSFSILFNRILCWWIFFEYYVFFLNLSTKKRQASM